jgi:hypothetical protein
MSVTYWRKSCLAALAVILVGTSLAEAHFGWWWRLVGFERGFSMPLPNVDAAGLQDYNNPAPVNTTMTYGFEYTYSGGTTGYRAVNIGRGTVDNALGTFVWFSDFDYQVWHPFLNDYGPQTKSRQWVSSTGRTVLCCAGTELNTPAP